MKSIRHTRVAIVLLTGLCVAGGAMAGASPDDAVVLRFAVLGDAEPKPDPEFPNLEGAVQAVNALAAEGRIDFVAGVGDIAHKGTMVQYENATKALQALTPPFYPIMGNEEHGSTVERFLEFANRWNEGSSGITSPRYVQEYDDVALVYASPDFNREFDDDGIGWMKQQIQRLQPKPVLLIVHAAQAGVYPEGGDKGVSHPGFAKVLSQPNLAAVISGDLHMDMDRVDHSKQVDSVHYLHIPALERTKIPDKSRHTPMFRTFTVYAGGEVKVDTYQVGVEGPLARHAYRLSLPGSGRAREPVGDPAR